MRHYAGYASGLTLALVAATLLKGQPLAVATVFIAFAIGKIASDAIVPPVIYRTSPKSPRSILAFAWALVFAVPWWGIPFGALATLAVETAAPDVGPPDYAMPFAVTSVGAVILSFFMLIFIRITRGRPARA